MHLLLLATLAQPAQAWDDVRPFEASGTTTEALDITVPLGFAFDVFGLGTIWVGAEIVLSGQATIGVVLSGTSTLTWGELGRGTFEHRVDPEQTALDLDNLAAFDINLTVRQGSAGGTKLIEFTLIGDEVPWIDTLGVEDGALLPGGSGPEVLVARKEGPGFSGIGFSTGAVGVSVTQGLTGVIRAEGEVRGVALRTLVDGVLSDGTPFDVAEGTPGLDVKAGYDATVDLDLAYEFTADPVITVNLGFSVPIPIPLKGETIQAYSGTVDISAAGETRHAFGRVGEVTAEPAAFTKGAEATITVVTPNTGEGALELVVDDTTGDDAEAFIAPLAPWTVDVDATGTVEVEVSPKTSGTKQATLVLGASDPWSPTVSVPLLAEVAANPDDPDPVLVPNDPTDLDGCGCSDTGGPRAAWLLPGLLLFSLRRRR